MSTRETEGMELGTRMYSWAADLFPVHRSITGEGVRTTLAYLQKIVPELKVYAIPSGQKVFDWEIPLEWNVRDAYILDELGRKIADFKKNNLHLVGYSVPVSKTIGLDELQGHLYSLKDIPDAVPYVTSFYNANWGFCMSENERRALKPGKYKVHIDSDLKKGNLNYGEIILKGKSKKEILLSTYICHPSMANNELSGPVVAIALAKWLKGLKNRRYTYRIVFLPETIGSIAYISKNRAKLKSNTAGGFVITCVGDNKAWSMLESRDKNSIFDRVGKHVLKYHTGDNYKCFSFLHRGSDERQYSSVGVDLPMVSLMRSKYAEYREYHTSHDNMSFISPEGLLGGYSIHKRAIEVLENNLKYKVTTICEPRLGKRGLYPHESTADTLKKIMLMSNIIGYADGKTDLLSLAEKIEADFFDCLPLVQKLSEKNVLRVV